MYHLLRTPAPFAAERLAIEIRGGIPPAECAARIKFGLEALPEVDRVFFVPDGIEVALLDNGPATEALREVLVGAGFAEDTVQPPPDQG
jgi:hypothetical protein